MPRARKLTDRVKREVALGVANGKSNGEIAAKNGLASGTIARIRSAPEIRSLARQFADKHQQKLDQLYEKTLDSIARDLDATEVATRQYARKEALHVIETADRFDRREDSPGGGDGFSLQELTLRYLQGRAD